MQNLAELQETPLTVDSTMVSVDQATPFQRLMIVFPGSLGRPPSAIHAVREAQDTPPKEYVALGVAVRDGAFYGNQFVPSHRMISGSSAVYPTVAVALPTLVQAFAALHDMFARLPAPGVCSTVQVCPFQRSTSDG